MGWVRTRAMGTACVFCIASITLLIVAIVIPHWQEVKTTDTFQTSYRYGLWGYKSCSNELFQDPCNVGRAPTNEYPVCDQRDDEIRADCKANKKAIQIVKIGLLVEVSVTALFFLYCLAKIHSRFKNVAETGLCGWFILPLPLLGSIAGAICWGLYYNYNPFRHDSGASWGPCFWIAMAGWICGVLSWVPRLIYRVY